MAVGDTLRPRLAAGGKVKQLVESRGTPEEVIEELFIRALSRRPTDGEVKSMRELVGDATKEVTVYEDIFWGLLNSTEFAFNH